jgi:hypothetical protein
MEIPEKLTARFMRFLRHLWLKRRMNTAVCIFKGGFCHRVADNTEEGHWMFFVILWPDLTNQ